MVGTILFKAVFDLESVINLNINHRINLLLRTCETCIIYDLVYLLFNRITDKPHNRTTI